MYPHGNLTYKIETDHLKTYFFFFKKCNIKIHLLTRRVPIKPHKNKQSNLTNINKIQ